MTTAVLREVWIKLVDWSLVDWDSAQYGLRFVGAPEGRSDGVALPWFSNTVTLNGLLVVGILGYFGIQTTTFAALIAAGGVAIGLAWSELLVNFAADAFLVVLRPMKVGDFVTVAGRVVRRPIRETALRRSVIFWPERL